MHHHRDCTCTAERYSPGARDGDTVGKSVGDVGLTKTELGLRVFSMLVGVGLRDFNILNGVGPKDFVTRPLGVGLRVLKGLGSTAVGQRVLWPRPTASVGSFVGMAVSSDRDGW